MMSEEAAEGKPAIVVTGASSGIGRAIAKVAARDGGTLVLVARSRQGLAEASVEVRQAGGEPIECEVDLLADDATMSLDAFLARHGLICDVLVNSAGYGLRGAATKLPIDDQLGIVDLNIHALAELSLHFLPGMVRRKRGGIINMSSIAGFAPGPYMALYFASKGFVRSFSEALYQEVHGAGVTVTCVAPGPVPTDFSGRAGARQAGMFNLLPQLDPDRVAELAWAGFKSGRRMVIPGISARLMSAVLALSPSFAKLPLIAWLQRSGNDPCPCGSGKKYKKCCGAR